MSVVLPETPRRATPGMRTLSRFGHAILFNRKALAGAILMLICLVMAAVPNLIAPGDPNAEIFLSGQGPSAGNWLGTTSYGQDIFAQFVWGARNSLIIAVVAGLLSTGLSALIGGAAGYLGGTADGLLSMVTDIFLVIPAFPLVIVLAAYSKSGGNGMIIAVLVLTGWSYGARQLRAQVLSLRHREFLTAARLRGERSWRIITHEILPNMISLLVANFLGASVYAILTAAGLQFIGLGNVNTNSWGTMLYWAQNEEALQAGIPLWAIMPGLGIAVLGGGLRVTQLRLRRDQQPGSQVSAQEARKTRKARRWRDAVSSDTILDVSELVVDYATAGKPARAVDKVSFNLARSEFLGVVGESGCGKSTMLFAIAQLLSPPAQLLCGEVLFRGRNMVELSASALRATRWRDFSVVMQSAMNALNPVKTVGAQFEDVMRAHGQNSGAAIQARSREVLALVGIDAIHLKSFPHQLSGGMRQRVMIAMALLLSPDLIVMDEPTSALDVVAQRSLMVQIKELQRKLGFAVIFVTHDMSLVGHFSDRLAVMYAGRIVEIGPTRPLFAAPRHPYTQGLLESFPSVYGPKISLRGIPGAPPGLTDLPSGCRFRPRCAEVMPRCGEVEPALYATGETQVRCLLSDETAA